MQRLLLFNWLRNRRYEKERGSTGNWEDSWNFIGAFFGGTGSMFISYNKATTSMGERLDQGSALRM